MIIEHFLDRLQDILSTAWGWITFAILFIINCMSGHEVAVGITVIAILMDTVWAIVSSLMRGKFAKSKLARDTFAKASVYGCVIFIFCSIDKLLGIHSGLTTNLICAAIVLVEFWSSLGSMIICFPNIPFLHLIKIALTGEIASKLGISEEQVKGALETMDEKRKEKKNGDK